MRRFHQWLAGTAAAAALILLAANAVAGTAYTYTYAYTGPHFAGSSGYISVAITVPALLTPSSTYSGLPPGTSAANIRVWAPVAAGNFSLPVQTFAVSTDSAGNIASWIIQADSNNLTKTVPLVGTDHFASSTNTLSTTVTLPRAGMTRTSADQSWLITYYKSCTGVSGCWVSSGGQPYVTAFSGIVSPAVGKWTVTKNTVTSICSGSGGSGTGCGSGTNGVPSPDR